VPVSAADPAVPGTDREYRQYRFSLPPDGTDLLLIRHGESEPARRGRSFPVSEDGQADPVLAAEGRREAERLADRLAGAGLTALYVSTLRRTTQTAAPLAARLGLPLRVEPDLREVFLGEWEGAAFRINVADRHPLAERVFTEQRWDVIPGAEPSGHFERRVRGVLERLRAAHPDQRLAVFTHGGFIGQALALAGGGERFAFANADNASISQLVITPDRWIVRRFNDTTHLDPALTVRAAELT
jgi:probable phosphoglycerate mutase